MKSIARQLANEIRAIGWGNDNFKQPKSLMREYSFLDDKGVKVLEKIKKDAQKVRYVEDASSGLRKAEKYGSGQAKRLGLTGEDARLFQYLVVNVFDHNVSV